MEEKRVRILSVKEHHPKLEAWGWLHHAMEMLSWKRGTGTLQKTEVRCLPRKGHHEGGGFSRNTDAVSNLKNVTC